MKKLPLLLPAGLLLILASCNNDNKSSENKNSQAERNLASFHAINKAVESGDMSKIGDYIAADGIDHAAGENGDLKGLDSIKVQLAKVHNMAKDMKSEIIRSLYSRLTFLMVNATKSIQPSIIKKNRIAKIRISTDILSCF